MLVLSESQAKCFVKRNKSEYHLGTQRNVKLSNKRILEILFDGATYFVNVLARVRD
jgi:hypothetical protein